MREAICNINRVDSVTPGEKVRFEWKEVEEKAKQVSL